MKTRRVLGKRIVAVEHKHWVSEPGSFATKGYRVDRLILEDGTVIVTDAHDTEIMTIGDLLLCDYKDKAAARRGLLKLLKLDGETS